MRINNGKATINKFGNHLNISIRSKKNWFVLLFGTVWLGGWFFGFISAIESLGIFNGEFNLAVDGFLTFWLIGWTVAGSFIIGLLLWGYFGIEKIELSNAKLNLSKTIFGLGIRKSLALVEVKNFRFNEVNESYSARNSWAIYGPGPGKVKFDYGLKTYSFALAVDEAEAHYLIKMLNEKIRLPEEYL